MNYSDYILEMILLEGNRKNKQKKKCLYKSFGNKFKQ